MRYNTAVESLETAKKTSRQVDKFGEKVGIKLVLVLERSVIFFRSLLAGFVALFKLILMHY